MSWADIMIPLSITFGVGVLLYVIIQSLPLKIDSKGYFHSVITRWITMILPFTTVLIFGPALAYIFIFMAMYRGCLEYSRRLMMPYEFRKFLAFVGLFSLTFCIAIPRYAILLPQILLLIAMAFALWRIKYENTWTDIAHCILASIWLVLPISTFILLAGLDKGAMRLIILGFSVSTAHYCSEFLRILAMQALKIPMQSQLGQPRDRWRVRASEVAAFMGSMLGALLLFETLTWAQPAIIPQHHNLIIALAIGATTYLGAASQRLFFTITMQKDPLYLRTQKMFILDKIAPFFFTNITIYTLYILMQY